MWHLQRTELSNSCSHSPTGQGLKRTPRRRAYIRGTHQPFPLLISLHQATRLMVLVGKENMRMKLAMKKRNV